MKIFKNRGDIYIPQTKFKSDLEQKALLITLTCVVVFTAVFLLVIGIKYDFSAEKFFKPDNLKNQTVETLEELPEVSGKTNFLFVLSNEETEDLYFCSIIQVDLDTISYKACTLSNNTVFNGKKITDIYKAGGAGNVMNAVNQNIGISVDYYVDQNIDDFRKMYNSMGKVRYNVLNDVKYKDTSFYGFNIKVKAGEQNLDGDMASKLMRYYVDKEHNYEAVNEILLSTLSQQLNEENYEKKEKLFSTFIDCSKTNISVKNFTENLNGLKVLSSETTGVNVYNVNSQYEGDNLVSSSVSEIKGYFTK